MLSIIAPDGTAIAFEEARGDGIITIDGLRLPSSGNHQLVVGRFGFALGTTVGDYELTLTRIGVSSESGSALRYGDAVFNAIDDANPQAFYTFSAQRGDQVTISMQRTAGDLDSMLTVANSRGEIIAENDDDGDSLDSLIQGLLIREDGVYAIIAGRFGGTAGRSQGSFVLSLTVGIQRDLGRRPDLAIPILSGTAATGTISDDTSILYYAIDAAADQQITIRMERLTGNLDSFLVLRDERGREIASDDDSGDGQNAQITNLRLPTSGVYIISATRFEGAAGATRGNFRLLATLR